MPCRSTFYVFRYIAKWAWFLPSKALLHHLLLIFHFIPFPFFINKLLMVHANWARLHCPFFYSFFTFFSVIWSLFFVHHIHPNDQITFSFNKVWRPDSKDNKNLVNLTWLKIYIVPDKIASCGARTSGTKTTRIVPQGNF